MTTESSPDPYCSRQDPPISVTSPQTRATESSELELGLPFTWSLMLHLVVQKNILEQESMGNACEPYDMWQTCQDGFVSQSEM